MLSLKHMTTVVDWKWMASIRLLH